MNPQLELGKVRRQLRKVQSRYDLIHQERALLLGKEKILSEALALKFKREYEAYPIGEAVILVLENNKPNELSASEILEYMLGGGFKFSDKVKDPYVNVFITCMRHAKRKLIKATKRDNHLVFSSN